MDEISRRGLLAAGAGMGAILLAGKTAEAAPSVKPVTRVTGPVANPRPFTEEVFGDFRSVKSAKDAKVLWGGTMNLYNWGKVGTGCVTRWTNPNTYQFILYPGQWSGDQAVGGYTGGGWRSDVYYSEGNSQWYYQWSVTGPTFWSLPGWIKADYASVYSYLY